MDSIAGGKARKRPELPWKVRLTITAFEIISDASLRRKGTINRFLINLIDLKVSPKTAYGLDLEGVSARGVGQRPSGGESFRAEIERYIGVEVSENYSVHGGFDPLRDWQKRYWEGLKKNGTEVKIVDYPNAIHCFYNFPELHESTLFLRELKIFIYPQ